MRSLIQIIEARRWRPARWLSGVLSYGGALLAEGGDLPDPARFTRLLTDRLARSL
ncbi:hypothetical protein [Embleya sp. NPDC005575]|uniref:hypothetical protein n=1 Tax=Embleya sp. NPDC005575 TaxID=3156892 RepID=UPI0033A23DFB